MMGISKLVGMTVNERLYELGLLSKWNLALAERDRDETIRLLSLVELSDQAARIADSTLARQSSK